MQWQLTQNISKDISNLISACQASSVWLVCDRNTRRHCLPLIQNALPKNCSIITLPAGESSKTIESASEIWTRLGKQNSDRNALLICLGGGMICDLGGFAASVFKRGIRFVLLPTSLLAMSDACLGGKTAVDFHGFKNQLGTFTIPEKILIYPAFLKTLPDSELLSGLAEICKHTLCGNPLVWHQLRKAEVHRQNWPELIEKSLHFKSKIVDADFREAGSRKILNAGHTIGHALESFFLKAGKPQPHGYCIAAGLIMEGRIAVEKGLLEEKELLEVEEFVYAEFGMLPIDKNDIPKIIRLCRQDKKNKNGKILASLYGPVGKCHFDQEISDSEIKSSLRYYLGI